MKAFLTGDSRFFWPENIIDFVSLPSAWDASLNTGIGKSALSSLWINSYLNFTALFSDFGLSWDWISLLFWILPAIILSFLSSFFLFNTLFKFRIQYSILSGIIYTLNTYFLMIFTGGQLGVAMAYSIAPLVLNVFIRLIDNVSNIQYQISNFKFQILAGLVLSLQVLFDPRIAYITVFAVLIYFFFTQRKELLKRFALVFIVPFAVVGLVHSYWILPTIIFKSSPIPQGFESLSGFKFYSFADFSHALSLLHPNWPENIFGKTYFLKPDFLVLPILAYSSLLFINLKLKSQNSKLQLKTQILYFSLLGLMGAFLAKGSNPPFGEINIWIFQNIYAMSMFRDPTKFYLLIALSYSVLIPFSVYSFTTWISSNLKTVIAPRSKISNIHFKYKIYYVFLLFTIFFLLFLVVPVFGQIKIRQVPQEYVQLKDFLNNRHEFFRTLWIPVWQRYGFFSNNHPAIGREEIFKGDASEQILQLDEKLLRDLSVKYVIVPYDSESEIFLKDRRYDETEYQKTVQSLRAIGGLKEIKGFGKIVIFELENFKDHFWSPAKDLLIEHKFMSPTEYKVQVQNVKAGDLLIFSEGFDGNWVAKNSKYQIQSSEFRNKVNSFILSREGNYQLEVFYSPQRYVEAGLWISLATLFTSISYLLFGKQTKK